MPTLWVRMDQGAMAIKCTLHSPKLQHYWSFTIRLFNVISRTLVGGCLAPLQRCIWCILQTHSTEPVADRNSCLNQSNQCKRIKIILKKLFKIFNLWDHACSFVHIFNIFSCFSSYIKHFLKWFYFTIIPVNRTRIVRLSVKDIILEILWIFP